MEKEILAVLIEIRDGIQGLSLDLAPVIRLAIEREKRQKEREENGSLMDGFGPLIDR